MVLEVRYREEDRHVFLGDKGRGRERGGREGGRLRKKRAWEGQREYREILRWTAFILAKLEAKY